MVKFVSKLTNFLQQVKRELKRVKWPTYKELKTLTLIVIGAIITLGLYVSLLDVVLTKLIELGIK